MNFRKREVGIDDTNEECQESWDALNARRLILLTVEALTVVHEVVHDDSWLARSKLNIQALVFDTRVYAPPPEKVKDLCVRVGAAEEWLRMLNYIRMNTTSRWTTRSKLR
jgi:hypothetical protein